MITNPTSVVVLTGRPVRPAAAATHRLLYSKEKGERDCMKKTTVIDFLALAWLVGWFWRFREPSVPPDWLGCRPRPGP